MVERGEREEREEREERGEREEREEREMTLSPVDADRFTIIGDIYTSRIVDTGGVTLGTTSHTEGPNGCNLTLSIERLVRTECIRGCHAQCLQKVTISLVQKCFIIPLFRWRDVTMYPFHPKQAI
jgi:hypothetical protein